MTLRADSQRKAVILSCRASRTVLGKSFLELVGPLFFSITAFVASLLNIIEIAFCEATLLFIISFLVVVGVILVGFFGVFVWSRNGLVCDGGGGGLVGGFRLIGGGNGLVGPDRKAMDFVCPQGREK